MSEEQIAGMEARATGQDRKCPYAGHDKRNEWFIGFDLMVDRIDEIIRCARQNFQDAKSFSSERMIKMDKAGTFGNASQTAVE